MTSKRPEDMTREERMEWASQTIDLPDEPASMPAPSPAARTTPAATAAPRPARSRGAAPQTPRPDSPYGWIALGYVLTSIGLGGAVAAQTTADSTLATFLISLFALVGVTMMFVGTIAAGVRLGMRHAYWERDRQERR